MTRWINAEGGFPPLLLVHRILTLIAVRETSRIFQEESVDIGKGVSHLDHQYQKNEEIAKKETDITNLQPFGLDLDHNRRQVTAK